MSISRAGRGGILPGVLQDLFLIFHAQMTWPALSFPLHTVPIQKTTNYVISYFCFFEAWRVFSERNRSDVAGAAHDTFPTQAEAKVCVGLLSAETILPISHPLFACFCFPVAHTHARLKKAKPGKVSEVLYTQALHRNRPSTQKTHFQTKRSNNSTDGV